MNIVIVILTVVSSLLAIPLIVIGLEGLLSLVPGRKMHQFTNGNRERCIVLVPAHNEEITIVSTIKNLRSELLPSDQIIVIADNCSDNTSELVRQSGETVLERYDPERRGKGYALAYGLDQLRSQPPAIVVLIDADTRATPGSIDALVREATIKKCPIQGIFVDAPKSAGAREQWSAFALTFKNLIRPLGLKRLGQPCLLTGSGMAFPWHVIKDVELGSANIVEDMQLGLDLAVRGFSPLFCERARFESDDAPTIASTIDRRTRWEHGHVRTLLTQVPGLLFQGLIQARVSLIALALELAVPPLSLLMMIVALHLSFCGMLWFYEDSFLPGAILASATMVAIIGILCSWMKFGRKIISPKILILLPVYILWKIPIYLKLMVSPQRQWVRTQRKPIT